MNRITDATPTRQDSVELLRLQVRTFLTDAEYSVEELARKASLHHTTVYRFVRGEDFTHRKQTVRAVRIGLNKLQKERREQFAEQMHDTKESAQWL